MTAPTPVRDIGTISAAAPTRGACVEYLVKHEACRLGGDVVYAVQSGPMTLGQEAPWVWCSARLAEGQPASDAGRSAAGAAGP
jgi:hypothetical protein